MHFDLDRALEVLQGTPGTFRALLDGLSDAWTESNEGPETFSAWDNVGHLVYAERANWIPRARVILAGDPAGRFPPFDRFAHIRESRGKPIGELLDEFTLLRTGNLATLRSWSLTERMLDRESTHPDLGNVALRQLLATWVAHDLGHLAQTALRPVGPNPILPLDCILAEPGRPGDFLARGAQDVGNLPWREKPFVSVLRDTHGFTSNFWSQ